MGVQPATCGTCALTVMASMTTTTTTTARGRRTVRPAPTPVATTMTTHFAATFAFSATTTHSFFAAIFALLGTRFMRGNEFGLAQRAVLVRVHGCKALCDHCRLVGFVERTVSIGIHLGKAGVGSGHRFGFGYGAVAIGVTHCAGGRIKCCGGK